MVTGYYEVEYERWTILSQSASRLQIVQSKKYVFVSVNPKPVSGCNLQKVLYNMTDVNTVSYRACATAVDFQ